MKKREKKGKDKVGSSSQPASENDATVRFEDAIAKYLSEIGVNGIAAAVGAYLAAHPPGLFVPGFWTGENETEFLKTARQVYRAAHPPHLKSGRPSEENLAIDHLMKISDELGPQPTQGAMIKSLRMLNLSKNTAVRYARLYKLYRLSTQDIALFSQVDKQWLRKKFGAESLSSAWWDNRFWQWFGAKVTSSGLGEEIRKIFAGEYTEAEIRQKHAEMVILKDERMTKHIALSLQKTDVTIAKDTLTRKPRSRPKMRQRTPS